jgi:hypothetical protein
LVGAAAPQAAGPGLPSRNFLQGKSGDLGDFEDLGSLKGDKCDQQYTLPAKLDLERHSTVVVWCRAFSVAFTSAALASS